MGYDRYGITTPPEVDKDLQATLPSHGTNLYTLKNGYLKINADVLMNHISGLIKSDDTVDRTAIDNLISILAGSTSLSVDSGIRSINDVDIIDNITAARSTTSTGTHSWTVTASKVWIVLSITRVNNTRSASHMLQLQLSGGTADIIGGVNTGTVTAGKEVNLGGTLNSGFHGQSKMVLPAGCVISAIDENFVAADNVKTSIYYVEVDAA